MQHYTKFAAMLGKTAAQASQPADPQNVQLRPGKGAPGRGNESGGRYWHVYSGDKRVGHVYINPASGSDFGGQPEISIHINQPQRGRGIGREALRQASEQSGYNNIVATLRKSNLASRYALAHAGYGVIANAKTPQLAMRWTRP